jgi:putative phage-type endonuclease
MAVAISQNDAAREAWLRERRNGIGASEVGTILGLNPYESPFELYLRKRDDIPSKDESLAMWLGHQMEPIIAKRYEMVTKRHLHDPGEYAIQPHPDYPWLRATLDRTTTYDDGSHGAVELKAPGADYLDEWSECDAPLMYQAQLQIQMACTGFDRGEIAAMIGNQHFYIIPFERNDEFMDAIIPVLHEFWERVQAGDPPPVDGSESTTRALRLLHPLDNGKTVQLPSEIGDKIRAWQNMTAEAKALDDLIKSAKNEIVAAIGDNTFGEVDGLKISYKAQTRRAYEVSETTYRVLRKVGK